MYYTREEKVQMFWVTASILFGWAALLFLLFPRTISGDVVDVYWQSYVEIEEYRQVRVTNASSHPRDAYNISEDEDCDLVHHEIGDMEWWSTECDTTYDYTIDRWVVVYKSTRSGKNYEPTYNTDFSLVSSDTYGAQREGRRYVDHFIQSQFGDSFKTCKVSEKLWRKTEIGSTINTTRLGHSYTLCRFK